MDYIKASHSYSRWYNLWISKYYLWMFCLTELLWNTLVWKEKKTLELPTLNGVLDVEYWLFHILCFPEISYYPVSFFFCQEYSTYATS